MRIVVFASLSLALATTLSACGGSGHAQFSCTLPQCNIDSNGCVDYDVPSSHASSYRDLCNQAGGTLDDNGPCPTSNTQFGTCVIVSGEDTLTVTYYPGGSVTSQADAKNACGNHLGTWSPNASAPSGSTSDGGVSDGGTSAACSTQAF